ncbi:hypothetical protein BDQ17DRAFT_1437159 [Cyathus striatus]|nr:hypothetical protein BDQ17DRAFT_1437159 [Cyathus striatus]
MQFTSILATIAFITATSAVEISFYLGKNCHGQNLRTSSVHEVYHNYNTPDNTQSMVISDNGLNRNIIATDSNGCKGITGTADLFRGNGCFSASAVSTFKCYSLHK